MPIDHTRKYELVLLGATGYTGKLCAEYIAEHLPTDFVWAIAGRSESKLQSILGELKKINPDRKQPDIIIATLSSADLDRVTNDASLVINTVGPYHLYSSPVVAACAKNGTHYLDVTGEAPWTRDMIRRHHDTAKANNTILIPQIGIESALSDLLVWSLADLLRRTNPKTVGQSGLNSEVIGTFHEFNANPSGGTLATAFSIIEAFGNEGLAQSTSWTHSPIPHPKRLERQKGGLFGVVQVPRLGTLGDSLNAVPNIATVQRTWGLLDSGRFYGQNFEYREYMTYSSFLSAALTHYVLLIAFIALSLKPVRWLVSKFLFQPGQGAAKEVTQHESLEQRVLATVEKGDDGKRIEAIARLRFEGGLYHLTGLLLAEAAMCILRGEATSPSGWQGGLLTPACLGQPFIDRLNKAGVVFQTEVFS